MIVMSLRTRIALVVAAVALVFSLAGYAFQRVYLCGQFLRIGRQEAVNDLRRCEDAVEGEVRHIAVWCGDWANWDDPCRYLTDGNPEFIATNVTGVAMTNTAIDAMWLVATDGRVRHAKAWDHQAAPIVARQAEFATSPSLAEQTDLETAVAAALALVEPALRQHGVALEPSIESRCEFRVDRTKLAQILLNLLTNAEEAISAADPARRRLVVSAHARGERVRIAVTDPGCGDARADLPHLFTSACSTKGEGRGLGLHSCSVTAAEMGGSNEAASDGPGRGVTFTLNLPRHAAGAAPAAARDAAPALGSPA